MGGGAPRLQATDRPMTTLSELDTPAVTILLDRMEANINRVQRHLDAARRRQPAAHQDPQDPGDRQTASGRGRGRHHLPEGGRGRGVRRRRRVRRHSPDLQHHRRRQGRAADGADQADRAPRRGPGQRGGRARPVAGRGPARRGRAVSGRVRHRLRAQRRADARRRPGPRPPGHGHAGDAVRRPDDLPEQGARTRPSSSSAPWSCSRAPGSAFLWCPAAAPRRSAASASFP